MAQQTVASLSISARATLDMHSLNNEGGEGNQIQTRMVDIIGADGRKYNVNAISGDMLKHIQTRHFYELARQNGLPLCAGCSRFDANRINADTEWFQSIANKRYSEALIALLQRCAMDDIAGILITDKENKLSLPRKSVVEFGWVVGIPTLVQSDTYFHVKYNPKDQAEGDARVPEREGSNLGQAIFHRPASSGVYAIVCHVELGRIGYNDISQDYALDADQRQRRATALVQSIMHTFIELNGAMRATQLPHLVALEGCITLSSNSAIPAPLVSPLAGGAGPDGSNLYRQQASDITTALNGKSPTPPVTYQPFNDISGFANQMRQLVDEVVPAERPQPAR